MARSGGITGLGRAMLLHTMFGHGSQGVHAIPKQGWIALMYEAANLSGTGWDLAEPWPSYVDENGNAQPTGYARISVPLGIGSASWIMSGMSSATNQYGLDFPTAVADWGMLRYWCMTDDFEGGRLILHGEFAATITVAAGDKISIPAGSILVSLDSYDMEW